MPAARVVLRGVGRLPARLASGVAHRAPTPSAIAQPPRTTESFDVDRVWLVERVEAAYRYDVPVERGFAFITDTANWSRFWPGYVRLAEGSRWGASGDTARLVTRLLGRERELRMTLRAFEPSRLVTYTSTQPGLPDAYHERHFEPDGDGFVYRLAVEYEPRGAIHGLLDRTLLRRAILRAFERTFVALEQQFSL